MLVVVSYSFKVNYLAQSWLWYLMRKNENGRKRTSGEEAERLRKIQF